MRYPRLLSPIWIRGLIVVLLLFFFAQVMTAAMRTSLTSDEGPQVTSGYAYLKTGDMHLIEFDGHPPLAKVLNALPLMLVPDLGSPADAPSWRSEDPISLVWVTQEFFYPYRPLDRLVIAARVPVMLWGVILAALVYRWATDLFGSVGGLGALVLVVFDPNLLAHAGLATNDLAVTTACLAALFTFWRFIRFLRRSRMRPYASDGVRLVAVKTEAHSGAWGYRRILGRAFLAGVTLGIAQSTKLNALLLLPVEAAIVLVQGVWDAHITEVRANGRGDMRLGSYFFSLIFYIKHSLLVWFTAGLTLWASYGFELRALPIDLLAGRTLLIPAGTHLRLWARVLEATGGGHPSFLMGEISTEGWWHYFPVAFMIKTPLPTLIVLLGAGVVFIKRLPGIRGMHNALRYKYALVDELALLLFLVLYGAAMIVSRLNIGYRHLLPILPLWYILASRLFARGTLAGDRVQQGTSVGDLVQRGGGALLAVWLMAGTLKIWPFHLAFFNELIGGPDQGYHYLVDSNTDWGQALKALHIYLEREQLSHVRLSTYIEYDAAFEAYGLADIEPLPPLHAAPGVLPSRFNPESGIYVLSTTTLQGIFTADPEMYDWFRKREPDARIGHVMFLYDVSPVDSASGHSPTGQTDSLSYATGPWIAQCTTPVAPLSTAIIAEGFGLTDFRHVYFDCTQSWVVPKGGQGPGWYVLFRDTVPDVDEGFGGLMSSMRPRLVTQETDTQAHTARHTLRGGREGSQDFIRAHLDPYRLSFEQTRYTLVPPFAIYEAQAPLLAPTVPASSSVQVGSLTFLGHSVVASRVEGVAEVVWTYWQVVGPLPDRPLSLMLHLVVPGSEQVAVGDGLGVPVENWEVGDVIVQRHMLSLPMEHQVDLAADELPCQMYTGAYWLDTLERWPVSIDQVPMGDQIQLSP